MDLYHYYPGTVPVVVNIPHAGVHVPPSLRERFTPEAAYIPDTDWHVERLYNFVQGMHIHLVVATHSRYVVDLNRNKISETLYPGSYNTGVIPTHSFDKAPIYKEGQEPDTQEIQERIATYWQPYHNQLQRVLQDCITKHGRVVLFDAHSIKSQVPSLFEGELPDLNIGTADGLSADKALTEKVFALCGNSKYSAVVNGRFKGGFITRHYGKPESNCHAIQLELVQKNYMNEAQPYDYAPDKALELERSVLRPLMSALARWAK